MDVEQFVTLLARPAGRPELFNPWADIDPLHDAMPQAAAVRRAQLAAYLSQRLGRARWLLVAEGLSYQGGKFTGIAMTSERILLGGKDGVPADAVFRGDKRQTSGRPGGFNEPTASIVWSTLLGAGMDPYAWVNWNAFPWHPHPPGQPLANRAPSGAELKTAAPVLTAMRALFPAAQLIAVGGKSAGLLKAMEISCAQVRHPARGGANEFRRQILELMASGRG